MFSYHHQCCRAVYIRSIHANASSLRPEDAFLSSSDGNAVRSEGSARFAGASTHATNPFHRRRAGVPVIPFFARMRKVRVAQEGLRRRPRVRPRRGLERRPRGGVSAMMSCHVLYAICPMSYHAMGAGGGRATAARRSSTMVSYTFVSCQALECHGRAVERRPHAFEWHAMQCNAWCVGIMEWHAASAALRRRPLSSAYITAASQHDHSSITSWVRSLFFFGAAPPRRGLLCPSSPHRRCSCARRRGLATRTLG